MLQILITCILSFPTFIAAASSTLPTRGKNLEPRVDSFSEGSRDPQHGKTVPNFDFLRPALPRPIAPMNWGWTIKTVQPHYATMGTFSGDLGLKPSIVYDDVKHTIGFSFQPGYEKPYLEEGNLRDNTLKAPIAQTITYRIPGFDGLNRAQRILIVGKSDQEQTTIALNQGQKELQRAIAEIVTPVQHADPQWFWNEGFQSAATEMANFSPQEANWIWNQIRLSLGRFLPAETRPGTLGYRSKHKRSNSIAMIQAQEFTTDPSTEFSQVLQVFTGLQANISSLLFPVLNDLIAGSNNSIVYQMALSIYSDITLSTAQLIGPFKSGMTAFTSLESQVAQRNNITIFPNGTLDLGENSTGMRGLLAMHSVYEELYLSTWDKAIKATNSTGRLADLAVLNSYLLPKNQSICPPGWANSSVSFLDNPDLRGLVMKANLTSPTGSPERKRI